MYFSVVDLWHMIIVVSVDCVLEVRVMFSVKAIVSLQSMYFFLLLQFSGNFVAFCFQCGRPNYEDNCRACGARIGGQNHNLAANNAQIAELVCVLMFLSLIGLCR